MSPVIATYTKAYGMAAFSISPSLPCWFPAEVAMAMLCGEMIFPPVAPTVLAATANPD